MRPLVIAILDGAGRWQRVDAIRRRFPGVAPALVDGLVGSLVARGLLEQAGMPVHPADAAAAEWNGWYPAAGFFHQATRNAPFWPRDEANAFLRAKARHAPPPAPERMPAATDDPASMALPPVPLDTPLAATLRARRTWRRFGRGMLELDALGSLLGLTWGVQAWVDVPGFGSMPLKTAPSGGARHSIEAYVAIRRVRGVTPGVYHYSAGAHRMMPIRTGLTRGELAACFPQQAWTAGACAVVFMTSVLERVRWRYPFARAYRTVLAEAGHHAQTFCLLATADGLAPFCTMALADSRVERLLAVDGLREPVLYAVGVGRRPAGADWAPWPGTAKQPRRTDVRPGRR